MSAKASLTIELKMNKQGYFTKEVFKSVSG